MDIGNSKNLINVIAVPEEYNPLMTFTQTAARIRSGPGAAFLSPNCLIFLSIWAQPSRQVLLDA